MLATRSVSALPLDGNPNDIEFNYDELGPELANIISEEGRKILPSTEPKKVLTRRQSITQEVAIELHEKMNDLGNAIPENNYCLSFYTIIFAQILKELRLMLLPQSPFIGPGWNYFDAVCGFLVGMAQLTNHTTHRPITEKVKGVSNILNSAQLVTLTAINFTILGGPGFAAAFAVGFLMSFDETIRAKRRLEDKEYWLKDNIAQLIKLETLIKEANAEVEAIEESGKPFSPWALKRKKDRLDGYLDQQKILQDDILVRVKSMACDNYAIISPILDEYYAVSEDSFTFKIREAVGFLDENLEVSEEEKLLKLNALKKDCQLPENRIKENIILDKCEKQYKDAREETAAWFVAFAGMLLMCFPPTEVVGIVLVGLASAYYLKKNASKIATVAKSIFQFFCPPSEETLEKEQHKVAKVSL